MYRVSVGRNFFYKKEKIVCTSKHKFNFCLTASLGDKLYFCCKFYCKK
ncbi:hypothetical protein HMPREF9075_01375 [Capnocytophaga sp. oral taxon 332 str. F0381]|nr:hypothetical protein HMPREF9075_01375 [Capnocytophaga sp. oral taxon 332 str. F0381]